GLLIWVVAPALSVLRVGVVIFFACSRPPPPYFIVGEELDLLVREHLGIVPKQAMERRVRPHLAEPRYRAPVPQQRLRRHQDQRLADVALELPAQDVEVVGGRGGVCDLHIGLGAHLQKTLEARRGMFWSLPLVSGGAKSDPG